MYFPEWRCARRFVRGWNEELPNHLRLEVAHLAEFVANQIGEVEKHTAARATGQPGYDVGTRTIGTQPKAGCLVGLGQRFVVQERLDLLANTLCDKPIIVE